MSPPSASTTCSFPSRASSTPNSNTRTPPDRHIDSDGCVVDRAAPGLHGCPPSTRERHRRGTRCRLVAGPLRKLSERLTFTPSGTGSTVDEMFHEGSDRPLLALAEAGGGKRPAESTLVRVCAGWHFITGQFHQSPVRDVEMPSEGAKYSRGWRFDLSSLELLEVCSRDTSGVCGGLERLTNLRSGVGKFSAELTWIPHLISHRSDRTQ